MGMATQLRGWGMIEMTIYTPVMYVKNVIIHSNETLATAALSWDLFLVSSRIFSFNMLHSPAYTADHITNWLLPYGPYNERMC